MSVQTVCAMTKVPLECDRPCGQGSGSPGRQSPSRGVVRESLPEEAASGKDTGSAHRVPVVC